MNSAGFPHSGLNPLGLCISRKPLNPLQTFIITQCFGKRILLVQRSMLAKEVKNI